ncbi:signal-induced proliferation-associated 1-like protein 1 isoform X2 [Xyrauchen texanus]|uniref:signal-induced proliferation-associated 1-like protein 1 isoform X2 n=1 Tax=Xyrauchen texanus TaxID=154827 RepID=UPI002241EB55|nr:signal-induced proliferation-associated 1-like protein 1 isoform X2 [Xyrauchen texanus]
MSTTPPQTLPLHFPSSDFRYISLMSSYDHSHCSSPMQDSRKSLDWNSSQHVEFTRLNPSRTNNTEGEWHMVTATRSLLGREKRGQKESLQDQSSVSYSSLTRTHFLQPNRESSAFSPCTNDFRLNGRVDKNIAESPWHGPKRHPLRQPGFYSPQVPRSKHCETGHFTKNVSKGSSPSNNIKEFYAHTLPLLHAKTPVLKLSPLCCKPQEVKTYVVEKPPLMRALISQTSPNSSQPSKKDLSLLQRRGNHDKKNQDQNWSSLQEPNIKLVWSSGQPSFSLNQSAQSQNLFSENISTKNQLSINTHLFPELQSRPDESATLSPSLRKTSQDGFSLSVDSITESYQGDPDQPCQLYDGPNIPECSETQKKQHREASDVRNSNKNYVKSQVDGNSKNVFGQPRVIASLRAACSPQPVRKSTVVEDLKKLIVMDDTEDNAQGDSSYPQQTQAELCSRSLMSGSCNSPLLSGTTHQSYPESPALTPIHLSMQTHPTECWTMPEQTEFDLWVKENHTDPECMPLPSAACDLDWNSIVQAAQAYETRRMATLLSEMSPVPSRPDTPSQETGKIHHSSACCSGEDTDSDVFINLTDQLSHLEGVLGRLSSDLLKEKRDKVALLAEMLKLRICNQNLKEESLCAIARLHKISKILNTTPGGIE